MKLSIKENVLYVALLLIFMTSCSSLEKRGELAGSLAAKSSMQKREVETSVFTLTTYSKITDKSAPINIYIEGDGFAFASIGRVSSNPTPKDAFTLALAVQDTSPNIVYIARPCQYTSFEKDKSCSQKYWSGSRFAPEVIKSVSEVISSYTKNFVNPQINLIGYSGGAAVAVLIAAEREDIKTLRTVAGNLDHVAVNKFHNVDNLDNSLNPIDVAGKLASLPQYHFAGDGDKIIPLSVTEGFARKAENGNSCVKVSSVNGATHFTGWQENWRELLLQPVDCALKVNEKLKK